MENKFLDYSGVELLWLKIKQLTDKKLEKVESNDSSIVVKDRNKISVRLSASEGNTLSVEQDGLYSGIPALHKLTFGSDQQYVYDGTEDVTVPVYDGTYD
jgi:hypothetical protein